MTVKELKQIYYLNKEIKMWQDGLRKLQCESLIKGQEITGMPFSSRTSDKVGDMAVKMNEIETIIRGKLAEVQVERKRIIDYINSVEDSYIRQIIFLRNVSCMSWEKIANELGGSGDSHRKACERFFAKEKK